MSRVVRSTPPPARWRGSTIWSERMGRALRSQSPNSPWSRPPRQAEVQEKRVKAAPPGPREISMRKMLLAAALLLPAFAASPAAAQEKVSMKCPVGGASFNYVRPARGAVVGLRPDGRPYGDSGKPALRKRYQEELVSASSDVPARTGDITWIGLEGRVIDALRELGRFDEASAKLAKIPMLWLDVQIPSADTADREEILAAKQRRVWLLYFRQEQAAIERKDSAKEPL